MVGKVIGVSINVVFSVISRLSRTVFGFGLGLLLKGTLKIAVTVVFSEIADCHVLFLVLV